MTIVTKKQTNVYKYRYNSRIGTINLILLLHKSYCRIWPCFWKWFLQAIATHTWWFGHTYLMHFPHFFLVICCEKGQKKHFPTPLVVSWGKEAWHNLPRVHVRPAPQVNFHSHSHPLLTTSATVPFTFRHFKYIQARNRHKHHEHLKRIQDKLGTPKGRAIYNSRTLMISSNESE